MMIEVLQVLVLPQPTTLSLVLPPEGVRILQGAHFIVHTHMYSTMQLALQGSVNQKSNGSFSL